MSGNYLQAVNHIVVLTLEHRSVDHMRGFLDADRGNVSITGQRSRVEAHHCGR